MKPQFNEEYQNPKTDPLEKYYTEFDFDTLYARLGEAHEEMEPRDYESLKEALRGILEWLIDSKKTHLIGRRCVALCWVISPAIFDGSPSLTKLSRRLRLHRGALSEQASKVSKQFSIRNRGQQHGWNWKNAKQRQEAEAKLNGGNKPK